LLLHHTADVLSIVAYLLMTHWGKIPVVIFSGGKKLVFCFFSGITITLFFTGTRKVTQHTWTHPVPQTGSLKVIVTIDNFLHLFLQVNKIYMIWNEITYLCVLKSWQKASLILRTVPETEKNKEKLFKNLSYSVQKKWSE